MKINNLKVFDNLMTLFSISNETWRIYHEINSKINIEKYYPKKHILMICINRKEAQHKIMRELPIRYGYRHSITKIDEHTIMDVDGNKYCCLSIEDILNTNVLDGREFTEVIFV